MDHPDYCEITSQLDAREILRYLNNLGIRNISGEVLKYFINDLKKLIKYDLNHRNEDPIKKLYKLDSIGPERLHSASTFSSRIRSKASDTEKMICTRDCLKTKKILLHAHPIHSAPNLGTHKVEEKPQRRACSCVRIDKKTEIIKESTAKSTLSNNLIKVPKQQIKKKSDPVSLYHHYTSLWAKYKPNVPGENNWSDLRWSIRQKMVGNVPSQVSNKHIKEKDVPNKKKALPTSNTS